MGNAGMARRGKEAGGLFDRIGAFLAEHRLSPDPAHYAFAHAVLSRPDTPMAREVADLTYGGVRLTREDMERLGGRVEMDASPVRDRIQHDSGAERDAARLVAETQAQVDGFADMMRAMQVETRGFGHDLQQSAAAITELPSVGGARDVARIADAMVQRVRDSETRLAHATDEAEALRAKLAEAQETARRDPLTGLANRLAFSEGFADCHTAMGPHCLALCDVDRFKRINDDHGHGVGDRVLNMIGQALAEVCDGQLVSRYGGEEFAVLLKGVDLTRAAALIDAARSTVATKSFRNQETGVALGFITFSAGVTAIRVGEATEQAVGRADRLLYAAKAQGRDRVCAG